METIPADWISIAGIVGILAFLWKLSRDIGDLRERMERLEGRVETLAKVVIGKAAQPQGGLKEKSMAIGPKGEHRPPIVIGCAVHVAKIATGEIEDTAGKPKQPRKAIGGGTGGRRRAESLCPARRSEIALAADSARWEK